MKALRKSPLNGIEEPHSSFVGEAILPLLEPTFGSNYSRFSSPRLSLDLLNIHNLTKKWLNYSDTKLDLKIIGSFSPYNLHVNFECLTFNKPFK